MTSEEKMVNTLENEHQELEEFESELGNVTVTEKHVEREQVDNWDEKRKSFRLDQTLEIAYFSSIEKLKFSQGENYPSIVLKLEEGWKNLPFGEDEAETAEDCFKYLRYRFKAFRQSY